MTPGVSLLSADRWGVAFPTTRGAADLLSLAARADETGFGSFWLAEVYHHRSATSLAAAIAGATRRIGIGLGILPVHTRHPALLAMEAATLDELSAGRLTLGLGASRRVAEDHGRDTSPIRAMSAALSTTRALLDGAEAAGEAGRAMRLDARPARRIPLYVGTYAYSEQMLRVAGRHADGAIFIWTTPQLARHGRDAMAEAAVKAGRDPAALTIAAYLVVSIDDSAARARDACRPLVAGYARIVHQIWRRVGLCSDEDVDPVLAAHRAGPAAAAAAVSDRLLERVAIAGEPGYCLDRIREFEGSGLTLPIAYGVVGPDARGAMSLLARTLRSARGAAGEQ